MILADGVNGFFVRQILSGLGQDTIDMTGKSPDGFNRGMFDLAKQIGSTAVAPIAVAVVCIVFAIEMSRAVTRFDARGDALMRVMFAAVMRFLACAYLVANSGTLVTVVSTLCGEVSKRIQGIKPHAATQRSAQALIDAVNNLGILDFFTKIRLFVLLFLPFIISEFCQIGVRVAVVTVFFQIYMLTAFSALPVAFFASEETKQMGIGYLKAYASAFLRLIFLYIGVLLYRLWMAGGGGAIPAFKPGDDPAQWVTQNWGWMIMGSILLGVLIILSQSAARAVVGQ